MDDQVVSRLEAGGTVDGHGFAVLIDVGDDG